MPDGSPLETLLCIDSQAEEEEDEILVAEEDEGEDSEKEAAAPRSAGAAAAAGGGGKTAAAGKGPVAEAALPGEDDGDVAALISSVDAENFYDGPTPLHLLRWRRRGSRW